jgi:L-seryl-tRNA(Ser) seleniumtransferase
MRNLIGPVINATGVLLHTNLGRAPLRRAPVPEHEPVRYRNVEIDLSTGQRDSRQLRLAALLRALTGAEGVLVVNNGAAAVLLALTALASGGDVLVSRGELIEIGGGFRLPDVFSASGAALVSVGTTNKTRLADYRRAVTDRTEMVLFVHRSNFSMTGFVESVDVAQLSSLGVPLLADIGSGLLDASTPWLTGAPPSWLAGEPDVRGTLAAGAAVVCASGDKLLGGPQAGLILGREDLVARCASHPLARALRPGGLVLEALQETLLAYLRHDLDSLPFWKMASASLEELERRAGRLVEGVAGANMARVDGLAGAGSLAGAELPSVAVALRGDRRMELLEHSPPIVARAERGMTLIDLRTVDPADDELIEKALSQLR